jgi:hypothetical protein
MKTNFYVFFALSFVLLVSIGCNKIPKHAEYIPKDALLVGAVDMNKMAKKMIWNAVTGSAMYEEMQKDFKNEKSKEAMKDFSSIGLNQGSTIYFFYTGSLRRDSKICFLVGMKNQTQFEEFIQKNMEGIKVQPHEGYKSAQIESSVYAAWNEDVAMFFPMRSELSDSLSTDMQLDADTDSTFNVLTMDSAPEFNTTSSIETFLKTAFKITKENSVVALPNFKTLQNDGHDVSIWANYEEIFNQNQDLNTSEMQAFIKKDYFKDAALATGIDFEKGTTAITMDYFMSKDLADIYKKYSNKNVNEDLVKNIPSNDVAFIAAYNFQPQMVQDFLKKFSLDGLANLGLMMIGTSMDKIASTFKGDMVFAVTDINIKDTIQKIPDTDIELVVEPQMNFSFAMAIKDESAVDELLNKGVKQSILTKEGAMYTMSSGTIMKNKDLLVFSSKKGMAEKFLNGKNNIENTIPKDVIKNIKSNPMTIYLDMKKIMQFIPEQDMTAEDKVLLTETKNMFTYIEMYGGKLKNNANHFEGNVFFSNKEENSLIQLLNQAMKLKKNEDAKQAKVPQIDTNIVL